MLTSQVSCGSSDPETTNAIESASTDSTVDAGFIARAEAACKPYADYSSKTYVRLSHFNRYAPDPDLLPRVAAFLKKNLAYPDLASALQGLGEPASGGDAWATILADVETNAQDFTRVVAAAEQASSEHFTQVTDQLEQDIRTLHIHLGAAGMAASSCAAAEEDPLKTRQANG